MVPYDLARSRDTDQVRGITAFHPTRLALDLQSNPCADRLDRRSFCSGRTHSLRPRQDCNSGQDRGQRRQVRVPMRPVRTYRPGARHDQRSLQEEVPEVQGQVFRMQTFGRALLRRGRTQPNMRAHNDQMRQVSAIFQTKGQGTPQLC